MTVPKIRVHIIKYSTSEVYTKMNNKLIKEANRNGDPHLKGNYVMCFTQLLKNYLKQLNEKVNLITLGRMQQGSKVLPPTAVATNTVLAQPTLNVDSAVDSTTAPAAPNNQPLQQVVAPKPPKPRRQFVSRKPEDLDTKKCLACNQTGHYNLIFCPSLPQYIPHNNTVKQLPMALTVLMVSEELLAISIIRSK